MGQCTMTDFPEYSKPTSTQESENNKSENKEEK